MHTLTLKVQDASYAKFINFIKSLDTKDIEILDDSTESEWQLQKNELDKRISKIESGKATFLSIEETNVRLNDIMKIVLEIGFVQELEIVCSFIAQSNPHNSRNFKDELLRLLESLNSMPFRFRKSRFYQAENFREVIFKGYTITYKVNLLEEQVEIIGMFKNINR